MFSVHERQTTVSPDLADSNYVIDYTQKIS